jgi:hypothetical protein
VTDQVNTALREHVTGTTFVLTLRKTQIAALVWLDVELADDRTFTEQLASDQPFLRPRGRVWSLFVPGVNGLISRGLVEHIIPDHYRRPGVSTADLKPSQVWRITPAGKLVVGLLKEAGIWQEHFLQPEPAAAGSGGAG